ncbi:MAG: GTPase Era [Pseudomonadota bacterium]|nr:GTPase Era [Pseudomonadota bacterium]
MLETSTRAGFVAVIGAPNVGKSTLVNHLVGSKVSIVSPKVQTTRTRVLGIAMIENAQLVLVDTPGIFTPRRRLDRAMVHAAWSGACDADVIALMVDVARPTLRGDTGRIIAGLKEAGRRAILVLNKIDTVEKPTLLKLAETLYNHGIFDEVFMISALDGDGVPDLVEALVARLPESPYLFPEDQISDMPQRLMAAEITREQMYIQLQQELPYASTVETENWEEFRDGSVRIDQVIYIQRASQKGIVLGKGGARVKSIGQKARIELEEMFGRRVHLKIFVKVRLFVKSL